MNESEDLDRWVFDQYFKFQSLSHEEELNDLHNQCNLEPSCIKPVLHLRKPYKIHVCSRTRSVGIRFYDIIKEGVQEHPLITLTDHPKEADYIIISVVSSELDKSKICWKGKDKKIIVLDSLDNHEVARGVKKLLNTKVIFKRSFFNRFMGDIIEPVNLNFEIDDKSNVPVYPLNYPIPNGYLTKTVPLLSNRPLDLLCTLRNNIHQPFRTLTIDNMR